MKRKDFILINPNLNDNPRTKTVPANFTPEDHLENSLDLSKNMPIKKIIQKTLKDIGAKDIINNVIMNKNNNKLIDVAKGLVDFLDSKNMIKTPKVNTPAPEVSPELRNKRKK